MIESLNFIINNKITSCIGVDELQCKKCAFKDGCICEFNEGKYYALRLYEAAEVKKKKILEKLRYWED